MTNKLKNEHENDKSQSIKEHLIEIDKKCGNHFERQYPDNIHIILKSYFGIQDDFHGIHIGKYTEKYKTNVIKNINNKILDFDQYILCLVEILSIVGATPDRLKSGVYSGYVIEKKFGERYEISRGKLGNFVISFALKIIDGFNSELNGGKPSPKYEISFKDINKVPDSNIEYILLKFVTWSKFTYLIKSFILFVILLWLFCNWHSIIDFIRYNCVDCIVSVKSTNQNICGINIFLDSYTKCSGNFRYWRMLLVIIVIFYIIPLLFLSLYRFGKFVVFVRLQNIQQTYSKSHKLRSYDIIDKQNVFDYTEKPLESPSGDMFGFNLLASNLYYGRISNGFIPELNKIIIMDAKRGTGKSTFINYLINKINHITYRQINYCQQFKDIMCDSQIKVMKLSMMPFLSSLPIKNCKFEEQINRANINEKIQLNREENDVLEKLIQYFIDNLDKKPAKFLEIFLKSIDSVSYKGFTFKNLGNLFGCHDTLDSIKNKIKTKEQKHLIIIEDADRLQDHQLKVFIDFLWFIHELPFTITLIPSEEDKLKKAINISTNVKHYEELEEHKMFQNSFRFMDYVYELLARKLMTLYKQEQTEHYVNNSYSNLYRIWQSKQANRSRINNEDKIKLFNEVLKGAEDRNNDWEIILVKRLYQLYQRVNKIVVDRQGNLDKGSVGVLLSELLSESNGLDNWERNLITNLGLNSQDINIDEVIMDQLLNPLYWLSRKYSSLPVSLWISESIINDIIKIFKDYNVSIREWKYIMKNLNFVSNLFIVQRIIFYIISYRYPHDEHIKTYLLLYGMVRDYKGPSFPQDGEFKKDRLLKISDNKAEELINNLERYPNLSDSYSYSLVSSYITSSCQVIAKLNNTGQFENQRTRQLFERHYVKYMAESRLSPLSVYDILSTDWRNKDKYFNHIKDIDFSTKLILTFNQLAIPIIFRDRDPYSSQSDFYDTCNLFLLQNMAILFLNEISSYIEMQSFKFNYWNQFKLYDTEQGFYIEIDDQVMGTTIRIQLDDIAQYFQRLFNIKYDEFIYDDKKLILSENISHLNKLYNEIKNVTFKKIYARLFGL